MYKVIVLIIFFISAINATSKEEIKKQVETILAGLPATTKTGIMIYDPLTQDTLLCYNHTESMIPASNTKLFTTATALALMGGDYMLSTKLFTDDPNTEDGSIDGNLYLKGYGNPLFSEPDMDAMINALREKGIFRIAGDVVGDDSYFDNIYRRDDWIADEKANVKLPPISAIVIDRNITVSFKKRGRRLRRYINYLDNPAQYAANLLKTKLNSSGIIVGGKSKTGIAPFDAHLISETGISVREIIKEINKESDNFLAECLFKAIGAYASGKQGSAFYSTQAILNFIDENEIYSPGTAVVDGSGISRFDQITVGAIVGLLEKMYFDLKNFEDYYNSLSIAGIDGTLRSRLTGTAAENNFHGKTGTLKGVSSLSGYLTCENGEDLIVSIFFEYKKGGAGLHRQAQDDIITALTYWDE